MSEAMTESWGELAEFIAHRHSLDIGALNRLLLLSHNSNIEEAMFARQAETFLQAVGVQAKGSPQLHSEALALIALDALLFNLFRLGRGGDGFKPASSSFYGWMSMSQLSGDFSQNSNAHEQPRRTVALLEHLANCQPLFKRVRVILERPTNRDRNHRYADNMFETLDYILSRQKCPRDNFLRQRSRLSVNPIKNKPAVDFQKVNEIIFSNQLNKVARLLTEGGDELHLALIRIYFAEKEQAERKQFEGKVFSGSQMIHNLHRYYVESFEDENELFEESKHPLFRFIKNELVQFFGPFLLAFHAAVARLGLKGDQENACTFYKSSEAALREELLKIVRDMPVELVQFLHTISHIIQQVYRIKRENCLNLVKKLLFYCFLCSQGLMQDLLPHIDPAKYSAIYNHILNLFFQSSLRKFNDLPQQKLTSVAALVEEISLALDERINNGGAQILQQEGEPSEMIFRLKDPILNYDYQLVWQTLEKIEFTPKDMKKFTMVKQGEEPVQSPVYKHFRKEASVLFQNQVSGQADMAAWMSVGGSRDWGQTRQSSCTERRSVKERLKGLTTLRGQKVKELNQLRSQFQQYLPQ